MGDDAHLHRMVELAAHDEIEVATGHQAFSGLDLDVRTHEGDLDFGLDILEAPC